jgi:hypothetical protein
MQITTIEIFTYWIKWCNWLFVKVTTDEGMAEHSARPQPASGSSESLWR